MICVWFFLLQDAAGSVKLWDITRGVVVEDYGKVFMEHRHLF
jgi:WD repeat-containing protein 48